MERVNDDCNNIEIYQNDIDLWLETFRQEQNLEDLRTIPQSVWNAALMYVNRKLFKGTNILMSKNPSNIVPYGVYDYDVIDKLADYYIYLCGLYNKEISIIGFSNLSGINHDTFYDWAHEERKLSAKPLDIYKKIIKFREESLSNKLADGKQNPVGVIAMLNRHYGWNSPYAADANKHKTALTDANLPKLGQISGSVGQIAQRENDQE